MAWAAGGDGGARLAIASGEPWLAPAGVRSPVLRGPDGDISRAPASSRLLTLRESGFHEVHDGRTAGLPAALLAVNPPPGEADLTAMDPDDLLLGIGETPPASALSEPEATAAREARQIGWRWVLIALLCILVVEALVASHGWRAVAIRPATGGGGQKGMS
jgi:hypothetical protein